MSSNPYAAPKAPVADATSALQGDFLPEGRAVSAGRGWSWIAEGFDLFKRQPGMWIGIVLIFGLIVIAMAFIPILGSLAVMVLGPVFTAGIVIGCRALDEGGELQLGHLFAGFRERFGTLAAVGALYLAAWIVIMLVVMLVTGASLFAMIGSGGDPAALAVAGTTLLLAVLIAMALSIPLLMAIWFAPPLVAFNELGAVDAMKQSFSGCLKNIIPFLLYGVILFVLAIVASIPLALGWLVLGPTIAGSLYAAYRDIFFK